MFVLNKGLAPDWKSEIQLLQTKVGQLILENDFCPKRSDARSGKQKRHGSESKFITQGAIM